MGRAAHVFLHQSHAGPGLHVQPAGIEGDALADQADLGRGGILSPSQMQQTGRLRGGAAHAVDEGIALGEQILTDHGLQARAEAIGKALGHCLQRGRPHIAGGRVDEIAHQIDGLRHAQRLGHVCSGRRAEPRAGPALGLVAIEGIGPQRPGDGRLGGIEAGRARGQAIIPAWQMRRSRPEQQRGGVLPQAEDCTA